MNFVPSMANFPKRNPGDDDKSTSSDGTVEEPTETEQRYAALRNHQIRFADAIDPNAERVYKLRKKDIVFGRGRGFQNHPGNERMRDIIEKYKTQYHSLNRDGKRKLVEAVYEEITQSGARFLKKLDGENVWVVVDLPIALQKVSHTMRCRKSIIRQLDENGNVPTTLGGPSRAAAMQGMAGLAGMPGAAGIPGMATAIPGMVPTAAAIPGMGASVAGMPGMSPAAAGMIPGAGGAAGVPGLSPMGTQSLYPPAAAAAAAGTSDGSLAALEAQRMAALHRYRVLSGMAVARQGDIEYYQQLRREQLLRETRMLQQMGDAALLGGPSTPASPAGGMMPSAAGATASAVPSASMGVPGPASAIPGASMGVPGAASAIPGASLGVPGATPGMPSASMGVPRGVPAIPSASMGVPGTVSAVPSATMRVPGPATAMPGASMRVPGPATAMPGASMGVPRGVPATPTNASMAGVPGAAVSAVPSASMRVPGPAPVGIPGGAGVPVGIPHPGMPSMMMGSPHLAPHGLIDPTGMGLKHAPTKTDPNEYHPGPR